MADDPQIIAEQVADMIGARIEKFVNETTGEVSLSMETDDQGVSASGFNEATAYASLVREADAVGWRIED